MSFTDEPLLSLYDNQPPLNNGAARNSNIHWCHETEPIKLRKTAVFRAKVVFLNPVSNHTTGFRPAYIRLFKGPFIRSDSWSTAAGSTVCSCKRGFPIGQTGWLNQTCSIPTTVPITVGPIVCSVNGWATGLVNCDTKLRAVDQSANESSERHALTSLQEY